MKGTISGKNYMRWITTNKIRFVTFENKNEKLEEDFLTFYNFSYYRKYIYKQTHMREIIIKEDSEIKILGQGKYEGQNLIIGEQFCICDHPIFEDENQCIEAIKKEWRVYDHLRKRTIKINNELIRQNWKFLNILREFDDEMYNVAVNQNAKALKYVPKEKQTVELCLKAILDDYRSVKYIKIQINEQDLKRNIEFVDKIKLKYKDKFEIKSQFRQFS